MPAVGAPDPVTTEVQELHAIAPLVAITLAPEVDGHLALIGALRAAGHRVQLGHSNARYEDGVAALRCGAVSFTHLFNAMSALHHREPGLVGAALAHAKHAEIIPDLLHVHPGAIRAALRAIPRLFCVTDSTAATGMPAKAAARAPEPTARMRKPSVVSTRLPPEPPSSTGRSAGVSAERWKPRPPALGQIQSGQKGSASSPFGPETRPQTVSAVA